MATNQICLHRSELTLWNSSDRRQLKEPRLISAPQQSSNKIRHLPAHSRTTCFAECPLHRIKMHPSWRVYSNSWPLGRIPLLGLAMELWARTVKRRPWSTNRMLCQVVKRPKSTQFAVVRANTFVKRTRTRMRRIKMIKGKIPAASSNLAAALRKT